MCGFATRSATCVSSIAITLEDGPRIVEVRGVRVGIAGSKGFGGGFLGACGSDFGEPEMKAFIRTTQALAAKLERDLAGLDADIRIAVLHYSPIPETLQGERLEIYPFLGSYLLAEAIDHAGVVRRASMPIRTFSMTSISGKRRICIASCSSRERMLPRWVIAKMVIPMRQISAVPRATISRIFRLRAGSIGVSAAIMAASIPWPGTPRLAWPGRPPPWTTRAGADAPPPRTRRVR
jgi:hypothetical protein